MQKHASLQHARRGPPPGWQVSRAGVLVRRAEPAHLHPPCSTSAEAGPSCSGLPADPFRDPFKISGGRGGRLPNQAETVFAGERDERGLTVLDAPTKSVSDLDYLSVRGSRKEGGAAGARPACCHHPH